MYMYFFTLMIDILYIYKHLYELYLFTFLLYSKWISIYFIAWYSICLHRLVCCRTDGIQKAFNA